MRELIRPALFMVARLGLFLSIAAWIAGQFWLVNLELPGPDELSDSYCVANVPGGLVISKFWPISSPWHTYSYRITVCMPNDLTDWRDWNTRPDQTQFGNPQWPVDWKYNFLGIVWIQHRQSVYLYFCHWFVNAVFAAFNVLLHVIYRKHPEVQSCGG